MTAIQMPRSVYATRMPTMFRITGPKIPFGA